MSVLLIGDPHFKEHNQADTDVAVNAIIAQVSEKEYAAIIVLGDVLHDHNKCYSTAHKRACKFLITLASKSKTYVLMGNHDRPDNKDFLSDNHFFTGLSMVPHLHIIDKVQVVNIVDKEIVLVPYVPPGKFVKALLSYNSNPNWWINVAFLCAHQEFDKCIMREHNDERIYSKEGDRWLITDPPVFSGHIHMAQQYDNICYVGSMTQNSYDESQYKRVVEVQLADLTITSITLPVRAKILVELTEQNFTQYVSDLQHEITIRIACSIGTNLKEHILIKQWQDAGIKVAFQFTKKPLTQLSQDNVLQNSIIVRATFRDYLHSRVKNNPTFLYYLEQIFPVIKSN